MLTRQLLHKLWTGKTLIRALTEVELKRLSREITLTIKRILIAGGSQHSGSEHVFLREFSDVRLVAVNLDTTSRPHVVADLTSQWPFVDGSFDGIVATWVLEHLRDPWTFFKEAHRVLRHGGFLVIAVPFIHREHGSPSDYWRFTDAALSHLAQSAKLKTVAIRKVGGTPFVCAIALLWPVLRVGFFAPLLVLAAIAVDYVLKTIVRWVGRGNELTHSYPVVYILYAEKR